MEPPAKKCNIESDKQSTSKQTSDTKASSPALTYDILRIIFKFLKGKDLYQVVRVCSSWRAAALHERDLRTAPEHHLKHCKIVEDKPKDGIHEAKSIGREVQIQPSLGLIFLKLEEEDEWNAKGCYCENLPSNCNTVALGGYDLVADGQEVDEEKLGLALCAFLPKIPKLNKKIFHVDKHTFKGATDEDMGAYVEKTIKQLLPTKSEKSKCIIMLTNREGHHFMKLVAKSLQKKYQPGTISLWGGVCVDLKICGNHTPSKTCSQRMRWTAISLCSSNLSSYSIVLEQLCRSEKDMETRLKTFKEKVNLKKHSLALMFACCERILRKNLETRVFKKVFPNIPLVGLHGDGEYGLNSLNKKRESQLKHAFSTIFLILTYQ